MLRLGWWEGDQVRRHCRTAKGNPTDRRGNYFLPPSDPEVRGAARRGKVAAGAGATQNQDAARMTWG